MEKTQNRISSPEATGGAGPTFEQKAGVYWRVQLLVGCIPPNFVDSVVAGVPNRTSWLEHRRPAHHLRQRCRSNKTTSGTSQANICRKRLGRRVRESDSRFLERLQQPEQFHTS